MSRNLILSLLSTLLFTPIFGQVNWSELEPLSQSKKAAFIRTAHSKLKQYLADLDVMEYNLLGDCHVIDMDNDGDFDIIYNGSDGVEGDIVLVLRKDSSQFEVLLHEIGTITEFFMYEKKLESLSILNVTCCGAIHTLDLHYLTLGSPMRIQIDKAYIYYQSTEFPSNNSQAAYREYRVTSPELNMRYSLGIDTTTTVVDAQDAEKTNVIATFPQNARGWIIGKAIDQNGDVWYYMQMQAYPARTVLPYLDYDNLFYCGWMSAKHLEPVEP
ncbi:MAG: hypothetical protein EP346_12400 [Bacteroidetes bacterium]|nr:MAG: hypothetical protein EP346_12400 [Bacteroidota bacterium]